MTTTLAEVIAAAKALDPDEQELVTLALQDSDADEQAAVEAAWRDTIARRLNDLETGRVQGVSTAETLAIGRRMIAEWRAVESRNV